MRKRGLTEEKRMNATVYHLGTYPASEVPVHMRVPVRTSKSWVGAPNFGKIISIDLDGVILEFKGWQGEDVFGAPVDGAASCIRKLRENGWYVVIFTTRLVTTALVSYLLRWDIKYDDINARVVWRAYKGSSTNNERVYSKLVRLQRYGRSSVDYTPYDRRWYWKHNPERASIKPIASVYVDDMNWENGGQQYTRDKWETLTMKLLSDDTKYGDSHESERG